MAQSNSISNVIERGRRLCLRALSRAGADAGRGLPRNAIVRDAALSLTAEYARAWKPRGWYSTHCAHDKVFWERCAMCKRTTQADIKLAVRCMWEVLTLTKQHAKQP